MIAGIDKSPFMFSTHKDIETQTHAIFTNFTTSSSSFESGTDLFVWLHQRVSLHNVGLDIRSKEKEKRREKKGKFAFHEVSCPGRGDPSRSHRSVYF